MRQQSPSPRRTRRALARRIVPLALVVAAAAIAACRVGDAEERSDGTLRETAADSQPARFAIDASTRFPISRYIYGINGYGAPHDSSAPEWPSGVTLSRFGGNRLTAYNWENNASNAGRDWNYQNDDYLGGGTTPGEAVRVRVDGAAARGAGTIVTVPMIGYVARDMDETSVGTDPTTLHARLAARFVRSLPSKRGTLALAPDVDDSAVYQDEFVYWLTHRAPRVARSDTTPLFFALDNEPDVWGATHEEIMPKVGGKMATLTYDEFIDRTISYARAVKAVAPDALVFGPGTATWTGATTFARYPTPDPKYGRQDFLDVYLDRMRDAERAGGRRLLDVLDLHWYPEIQVDGSKIDDDMATQTPAMVQARLQAPRSLWDSTYDEKSWVSGVRGGPIRLLPLLREKIAAHYPGTKIAISEYFYGRGGDISGGIAQADVLGIFGREGVFAATLWPTANTAAVPYGGNADRAYRYIVGAFRMYRDYDGRGGGFGGVGLAAHTSTPRTTSVYASTDDGDASRVVLVAINKLARPRPAVIEVAGVSGWRTMEVYTLTADAPGPQRAAVVPLDGGSAVPYTMPPLSVSTLVLRR
ncbi:Glycoside hydrolase, family 44 [Gemmatirosa kalamazoonensis]|uniref:Glycoside hydrolase, family 44 n=1 Tax=Gemmatirosa kalamazoonensis TaxID=861299 RepID=W0R969_9BACT|nr:glycoside hydrolase family 44 protein [Gemmatirosa kalamazoonensis]AHG87659.1 Glycoside hydrolase, family 44 [Gemmatirosa kalamazoonensis]